MERVSFELIDMEKVPFRFPKAKLASNPRGSKWDGVLRALEQGRDKAVKIVEPSRTKRNKLKATLQTMAKNRGVAVALLDDDKAFYAWMTWKAGRFSPPAETKG
jgi:hypothetical protein